MRQVGCLGRQNSIVNVLKKIPPRTRLSQPSLMYPGLALNKAQTNEGFGTEPNTTEPTTTTLIAAVGQILRTQELLDMNGNPRLALEALMLSLPWIPDADNK